MANVNQASETSAYIYNSTCNIIAKSLQNTTSVGHTSIVFHDNVWLCQCANAFINLTEVICFLKNQTEQSPWRGGYGKGNSPLDVLIFCKQYVQNAAFGGYFKQNFSLMLTPYPFSDFIAFFDFSKFSSFSSPKHYCPHMRIRVWLAAAHVLFVVFCWEVLWVLTDLWFKSKTYLYIHYNLPQNITLINNAIDYWIDHFSGKHCVFETYMHGS